MLREKCETSSMISWVRIPSTDMTNTSHPVCPKNHIVNIFKTFQAARTMRAGGKKRGKRRRDKWRALIKTHLRMSKNLGHPSFLLVEPHAGLWKGKKKNQHTGLLTEKRVIHSWVSPAQAFRGWCPGQKAHVNRQHIPSENSLLSPGLSPLPSHG